MFGRISLKNVLIGLIFVSQLSFSMLLNAESYKLGVIDFERLYSQTPQGKEVLKKLQHEFANEREEIRVLENDISSKKAEYTLIKDALVAYELKKLNEEYRVLIAERNERKAVYENRFNKRLKEEREKLYAIYGTVIEKFATDGDYDALLDRNSVPYLKGPLDVTSQLLEELQRLYEANN